MLFEVSKVKHIKMTQAYFDKIMKSNTIKFISPNNFKDSQYQGTLGCFNGVPVIMDNTITTDYEIVYK